MKKTVVSIIIPVFNENESLTPLLKVIEHSMKTASEYEYIFIDDGSSDGSFDTLKELKKQTAKDMTIIRFRKNMGKSPALAAGFARARGDIIVTMDADLQDDPAEIPELLRKLRDGYDMVVGWRKKRIDLQGKIRLSRVFNFVVSKAAHVPLHDMNCGLKAFKKSVVEEIDLYGELHRFIPVLAAFKGFNVTEIQVVHHERKFGSSKFGSARIIHASFDLITTVFLASFKTRPLQIFGPIGLVCIGMGVIPLIYLSCIHFMGVSIGRRPLLQLGVLFILFGVQLFSTGLIGELITSHNAKSETYPISEVIT
jgi:glycosyltransferase involved in cell wall biosynthesis